MKRTMLIAVLLTVALAAYGQVLHTAKEINNWIHTNIAYDYPKYHAILRGENVVVQSPQSVLRTRIGICEEQAQLFIFLAQQAGIVATEVVITNGTIDHAMVYCQGLYYDPTWGTISTIIHPGWQRGSNFPAKCVKESDPTGKMYKLYMSQKFDFQVYGGAGK